MSTDRYPYPEAGALADRHAHLLNILRACGSVCVGYSGGVDSTLLLHAAVQALGPERVLAVTGISASVPQQQRELACECAARIGALHIEVATDEFSDPNYTANPSNRCYFCKTELWSQLRRVAAERGFAHVLDGTIRDDVADHRPGARAGAEQGIRSPLLEAGFTKADVRALSRHFGLPTWDQPAAPCLSSRLPYGLSVTPERLRQVEAAEMALRELGFGELRVRHHGDVARIELPRGRLHDAVAMRAAIGHHLRSAGFGRVLLDVEGYRRGALNEGLVQLQAAAS